MKDKRYFTNPLKVEKYDKQISGENWLMAQLGKDVCTWKNYAVTTDNVHASRTDGSCAAELAMLFSKSIKMYNLIKDTIKANDSLNEMENIHQMKKLIKELEEEIENHRKEGE